MHPALVEIMTARSAQKPAPAMILTTQEVRRQLKIIAVHTDSTMKAVLARLVAEELKRVMPWMKP
jgi:hypothetical protein